MQNRYIRQELIENFGENSQKKLTDKNVLIIGAGGLGCPVLTYLTAVGVGKITIADFDTVSVSNLNRQFFYAPEDVGEFKAEIAQKIMQKQNPNIEITALTEKITEKNLTEIVGNFDVVLDCVDNVETRLIINKICINYDVPVVEGAVFEFYGSVFVVTKETACLECLGYDEIKNRGIVGAIGFVTGVIGSLMVGECVKILLGKDYLRGEILHYDSLSATFTKTKISISDNCKIHKKFTNY